MSRAASQTWDEVWMHPVDFLVEREMAFYREEFEMVVEDLLALDGFATICAEGAALLPECVAPLVTRSHQAIWVVPTEEFQRSEYARREWVAGILSECTYPEQAWENWMDRDAGFARAVAREAETRGFRALWVAGSRSIRENAAAVAAYFDLKRSEAS